MEKQSTSCDINVHPIRGGGPVLIDGSTDLIELESDESLDELYFSAKVESNETIPRSSRDQNPQKQISTKNKLLNNKCVRDLNKDDNEDDDEEEAEERTKLNVNTITCRPISETSLVTQLSVSSSSLSDPNAPMCKICHMNAKENDPLISPCRCSGSMQFMHCGCLMRWLEITSKKSRKPLSCELCQYQYQWHKKFKVSHWQFPHCSRNDKILHLLFIISLVVMAACVVVTVMCFRLDKGQRLDPNKATELSQSEIVVLVCGILFFLAFFMAMYVEVKARNTIYKLVIKFIYLNQQWYIDEYDKKESAPVNV